MKREYCSTAEVCKGEHLRRINAKKRKSRGLWWKYQTTGTQRKWEIKACVCGPHSQQMWQEREGDRSVEMFFKMAEIGLALGSEAPYTARLKMLEERRKRGHKNLKAVGDNEVGKGETWFMVWHRRKESGV